MPPSAYPFPQRFHRSKKALRPLAVPPLPPTPGPGRPGSVLSLAVPVLATCYSQVIGPPRLASWLSTVFARLLVWSRVSARHPRVGRTCVPWWGWPRWAACPLGVDLWPVGTLRCCEPLSTSTGLNGTAGPHGALCELTRGRPQMSPSLLEAPASGVVLFPEAGPQMDTAALHGRAPRGPCAPVRES